ncbi:hypothetical protein SE17_24705 [Kouleothrix aurantiaca]|uniref:Uncharacterized protein n=1 Tax=Kouleothrix aurantiaca TaxID=186479 RepID=A0A0P9D6K0_9CHLR|nr:hypothetical protein SE17_24705 [Kouleothrix aurantiaca]
MIYLHIVLPSIDDSINPPSRCPSPVCQGTQFRLHQQVVKPLHDHAHPTVIAHRYRCLSCGHTFRVYPRGVARAPTSQRVRDLAVLLYGLGLSYGDVARLMGFWKIYLCKSQVYRAVQEATAPAERPLIFEGVRVPPLGLQPAQIHCSKTWVPITLEHDNKEQLVVTLSVPRQPGTSACQRRLHEFIAAHHMELQISTPAAI